MASEASALNDNGDWGLIDGDLVKGGDSITEELGGILDEIHAETGVDYTIFFGDTRVLTTILKKGTNDRLIGTKASEAVIQAVLNGKKEYSSDSLVIEGMPYYGYYVPLFNSDGSVAAMAFPCEVKARSTRLHGSSIAADHPLVRRGLALGLPAVGSPTLSNQALCRFPSVKLGPGDSPRSHTANEYVVVEDIAKAVDIYVSLLDGLTV